MQPRWAISRRFLEDLDAAALYAESLMNLRPWKPGRSTARRRAAREIVAVLESVLSSRSESPGRESLLHPRGGGLADAGRALPRERGSIAGAGRRSPVLMPRHIYARIGDQAAAAKAKGGRRGRSPLLRDAPPDDFYGLAYFAHNLHFLADSEMMRGRLADAKQARRRVAEVGAARGDDADGRIAHHHEDRRCSCGSIVTMTILSWPHRLRTTRWRCRMVALRTRCRIVAPCQGGGGARGAGGEVQERLQKIPAEALFGGTGLQARRWFCAQRRRCSMRGLPGLVGFNRMQSKLWTSAVATPTRCHATSRRFSSIRCEVAGCGTSPQRQSR